MQLIHFKYRWHLFDICQDSFYNLPVNCLFAAAARMYK
jgi:hypothetical protein